VRLRVVQPVHVSHYCVAQIAEPLEKQFSFVGGARWEPDAIVRHARRG
jgi:hypothetical protein